MQALPYALAASTALGGVMQYSNAQYQARVASNNAAAVERNAAAKLQAANEDMRDKDRGAAAELADLAAAAAASGLDASSGTMLLRRTSVESLAARDRERLATRRDTELSNAKTEAAQLRAQSKQLKLGATIGLLTTVASAGTSYLSGATMLNDYAKGASVLGAPSFTGGIY